MTIYLTFLGIKEVEWHNVLARDNVQSVSLVTVFYTDASILVSTSAT